MRTFLAFSLSRKITVVKLWWWEKKGRRELKRVGKTQSYGIRVAEAFGSFKWGGGGLCDSVYILERWFCLLCREPTVESKREERPEQCSVMGSTAFSCLRILLWLVFSLCAWLFVTPMKCSTPGSSVHGISQARILEWVWDQRWWPHLTLTISSEPYL